MNIDQTQETLLEYQRTTLPWSTKPKGVLFPKNKNELEQIVQQANSNKWKLQVISCGKNWGYNDRLAEKDNCYILDLSQMNRILEVNQSLGYAVVEPGVTQGMLFNYLEENKINLWMDGNGAGPNTSLIGNYLERGFGHSPLGDRSSNCCHLEVLTGKGEWLRTGSPYENQIPYSNHTYKYGLGPDLQGLFFQSNLGIVTEMTIWLQPKPESFRAFYIAADSDKEVMSLISKIGNLKQQSMLTSCIHLGNEVRSLTNTVDYPWDLSQEGKALPYEFWDEILQERGLKKWGGTAGVYGAEDYVKAVSTYLQKELGPYCISSYDFESAQNSSVIDPLGLLWGRPTEFYLNATAWKSKKQSHKSLNPLENNSGLIWFAPLIPAVNHHVEKALSLLKSIYNKYGFDLPITFTFVNPRTLIATTNIFFDQTSESEKRRVELCLKELFQESFKAGYPPYRLPLGSSHLVPRSAIHQNYLLELKRVFDPNEVLNPGRYV